jgi:hypothetical protein
MHGKIKKKQNSLYESNNTSNDLNICLSQVHHELNNQFASMHAYLQLLQRELEKEQCTTLYVDKIKDKLIDLTDFTNTLLNIVRSHAQLPAKEVIHINSMLSHIQDLIKDQNKNK